MNPARQRSGVVHAVKLYPRRATTTPMRSDGYPQDVSALEEMLRYGMPLLVHGEVTDPAVDVFDARRIHRARDDSAVARPAATARDIRAHHQREAVQFVTEAPSNVQQPLRASPAVQPQCPVQRRIAPALLLPAVLKRERTARRWQAAISGNPKFSSARQRTARPTHQGSGFGAPLLTAHAAIELYAEAFEQLGALDKLKALPASMRGLLPPAAQQRKDHAAQGKLAGAGKPLIRGHRCAVCVPEKQSTGACRLI